MSEFGNFVSRADFPVGINALTWGYDGRWLAAAWGSSEEKPGGVAVIDAGTGEIPVRVFDGDLHNVSITASPDRTKLAWDYAGGSSPMPEDSPPGAGRTRVLDARDGRDLWSRPRMALPGTASMFSPDGKLLVRAPLITGKVEACHAETGTVAWTTPGTPNQMVFSPDSKWLAIKSFDPEIRVITSAKTGAEKLRIRVSSTARNLGFTDDSKGFLVLEPELTLRLFNIDTGIEAQPVELVIPTGHELKPIKGIALSVDSRLVALASKTRFAVFDTRTGKSLFRPIRLMMRELDRSVSFSPDNSFVSIGVVDEKVLWRIVDTATGATLWELEGNSFTKFGFSPAGDHFATSLPDATTGTLAVTVFGTNIAIGTERTHRNFDAQVTAVAIAPAATLTAAAAVADRQGDIAAVFHANDGRQLQAHPIPGVISSLQFSRDGGFFTVGSTEPNLRLFHTDGTRPEWLGVHNLAINSVAISPKTGLFIATASRDKKARLFHRNLAAGEDRNAHDSIWKTPHPDGVSHIAISADDKRVATGCGDRKTRILDAANGNELFSFRHDDRVAALAFSPAGSLLATTGDAQVLVVDAQTGQKRHTVVHPVPVTHVALNEAHTLLITAAFDNTARIWRIDGAQPVLVDELEFDVPVTGLAFNPAKPTIAIALESPSVRIVDLNGNEERRLFHTGRVRDIAYSPDGTLIATASGNIARVFNI